MSRSHFRLVRGPLARRPNSGLPANRRLPAVYRLGTEAGEGGPAGELARDPPLALIEAVLLAADEPLQPRRLAEVAGLDRSR